MQSISENQAQQKFGELLSQVKNRGEEFVIEAEGQPSAFLIPYQKVQMVRRAKAATELTELMNQAAVKNSNADLSDEELENFVNQAIHDSRSHP